MKKTSTIVKVTACLVACSMLLIGNPIKAKAGWWACLWGNHKFETVRVPATCTTYAHYDTYCPDCGKFFWRETVYTEYAPHSYGSNNACTVCGYVKRK